MCRKLLVESAVFDSVVVMSIVLFIERGTSESC